MKYNVDLVAEIHVTVTIDAASKEDARKKAPRCMDALTAVGESACDLSPEDFHVEDVTESDEDEVN